jgi:hypothetical protein
MILETMKPVNTIYLRQVPASIAEWVAERLRQGERLEDFATPDKYYNLVMETWKESMCETLWDTATKLLITSQTTTPTATETTPATGILYEATSSHELSRQAGNPYRIAYQINDVDASSRSPFVNWGSLCWVTSSDELINRVLVPVTLKANYSMFIELEASIV